MRSNYNFHREEDKWDDIYEAAPVFKLNKDKASNLDAVLVLEKESKIKKNENGKYYLQGLQYTSENQSILVCSENLQGNEILEKILGLKLKAIGA